MSKNKRRSVSAKKSRKQQNLSSLVIPGIVGLVIIAIIVGAILSIENQQPASAALPDSDTAGPLPTNPPPYPNVTRISLQETREKIDSGQAVLIDVRSESSYDKLHAKGALSIPEQEIEGRLDELPRDKEVILYCT